MLPMLLPSAGCVKDRAAVEKNLMARNLSPNDDAVVQQYRVCCPDVIEIIAPNRTEFSATHEIGVDGRIDLGEYGKLRVEGKTTPEIARLLAEEIGEPDAIVKTRQFRSQHVLLFGEVIGLQRCVAYRGQETVLDLLQRVGGITRGAEPRDVYIVRPHLGDNQRPEVFHVDLNAIVLSQDLRTNIRLMPFDQIYVGETRKAQFEKAIPPWIRRLYQAKPEPGQPESR
jgi:polysaccharide export outer membrane protein